MVAMALAARSFEFPEFQSASLARKEIARNVYRAPLITIGVEITERATLALLNELADGAD